MSRVKRILAPTDFSEVSKLGLAHALEIAREESAELIVYHAIDFGAEWHGRSPRLGPTRDLLLRTRHALDIFVEKNFPELIHLVEVRQVVEFGAAHKSIIKEAASEGVDLIIMSTHGRTGIDHFMVGSVAEKVIARAPCPVLIVPGRGRKLAEAA